MELNGEFDKEVIQASKEKLVIADFYAEWCGPCKALGPVLEKLEKEMGFKLVKINTEKNQDVAQDFGVMSIPTVVFFKDGNAVEKFVGAYPESAIIDLVKKHM